MRSHHARTTRAAVVALCLCALIASACGQKSGVALSAGSDSNATAGDTLDTTAGTGGETAAGDATATTAAGAVTGGTPTASGGGTGTRAAGGTGTRAATPGAAGGGTSGGGVTSPAPVTGGKADRTGIDDAKKTITIGIHAPVTGAAPIPQDTFERGKDVYWKWLAEKGGLYGGYNVNIVFRDDTFNPTTARARCQEMVENDHVFLLVGAAGADQITSCARYADSVGVPYASAGVNTDGLNTLKNYFAFSMTYAQQAPLLGQLIKNKIGKQRVGLAVLDTPDFVDAREAAVKAIQANGGQVVSDQRIPKTAGKSETDAAAANLAKDHADVVYLLMSPTIFVNFVKSVRQQVAYDPDMVAPGVTLGLNLVAQVTCPDSAKLQVLSPFPELDVIDSLDPDYQAAYRKYVTASTPQQQPDDIGLALWGLNKMLHQLFMAASPDAKGLSRQSLLAALTSGREFKTNVYPPVTFSPTNHFGAKQAHLLNTDCVNARFKTVAQFATGF
jgi:branched-chain amino acid transport system substrate-binding protein